MKSSEKYICLSEPCLTGNEKSYVSSCMDNTWISSVGEYVDQFENDFAKYSNAKFAVSVINGTAGLHLALIVAGVKADDEVIVPAASFIATANVVKYVGAHPIFIDIEPERLGVSPKIAREYLEQNGEMNGVDCINKRTGRKISAIIPTHLYGHPCAIEEICLLAKEYNLLVIEDAAEAVGSLVKDRHVGLFGNMGCFSFNGNKVMTTGGGGMIVTDDHNSAKRLRHLATQAKTDPLFYNHDELGFNYRMSNLHAAIGVAQLEHIDADIQRKRTLQKRYELELEALKEVTLFREKTNCHSNCWMSLLSIPASSQKAFIEHMSQNKIQCRPFWSLLPEMPFYRNDPRSDLNNAREAADHYVCLPCNQQMSDEDFDRVIDSINAFF